MEVTPKHFITGVKLEISTRNFDSLGLHVLIKRRAPLEGGRVCNHETLKDGPKMTKKIFRGEYRISKKLVKISK